MTDPILPMLNPNADVATGDVEDAVRRRYSAASQSAEPALCCAVQYDEKMLNVLPPELIERDYGCGDPSKYLRPGDHVLDLGSGGGKICYIASQIVGPQGRVVGVDMNADMLALARRYQRQIAERIGWDNVSFHRARIQDLALDLDEFEQFLAKRPVRCADDWLEAQSWANQRRMTSPMIADASIDIVVSNCVLNLVRPADRRELFAEIFRVLRVGGRAVISDIVSDARVPDHLRHNAELWSGCISGAFVEHELIDAFAASGFFGMTILQYQQAPWKVVEGIEFRSVTVSAYKGDRSAGRDHHHAAIYRGPWSTVLDDDGNRFERGRRTAISNTTFERIRQSSLAEDCILLEPAIEVSRDAAAPFDFPPGENPIRGPQQSKSRPDTILENQNPTQSCCGPTNCCG